MLSAHYNKRAMRYANYGLSYGQFFQFIRFSGVYISLLVSLLFSFWSRVVD